MNFSELTADQLDDLRNIMESRGWDVFRLILEEEKKITLNGLYQKLDQRENDIDRGKLRCILAIGVLKEDVVAEIRERKRKQSSSDNNDLAMKQSMR